MQRRDFLSTSLAAGLGIAAQAGVQTNVQAAEKSETPAGSPSPSDLLFGSPVVSGPAPESMTILQAVNAPASGYVEIAIGDGEFQRIDAEVDGLLPYDAHVLKFPLPPLPANQVVRYRVVARYIDFQSAYKVLQGETVTSEVKSFRTLNPQAESTKFVVWNDTHENVGTIRVLQQQTSDLDPDFLMWNGDQTNNVVDPGKMRAQYLAPDRLEICARWPMAYARGNHDVRGPAAREVHRFTGTPDDKFYYAFRSGPVAALVMDTGEDKPDDRAVFAGLAGFEYMRRRQQEWLAKVIEEPWFKSAPYRVLFCHIPLWWIEDQKGREYWMCSEVCREAWLPLLQKGDIQLVISGHTHHSVWMPATASQPIGQLIGGGPKLESATIISGKADAKALTVTCKALDGRVLHEVTIPL